MAVVTMKPTSGNVVHRVAGQLVKIVNENGSDYLQIKGSKFWETRGGKVHPATTSDAHFEMSLVDNADFNVSRDGLSLLTRAE